MSTIPQEGNVTDQTIGVPTDDGVKNIHPDVLKGLQDEAFEWLKEETKAKKGFKELLEVQSENTGLPKALLSKWLKARYKEETKKQKSLADSFAALDEAIGA